MTVIYRDVMWDPTGKLRRAFPAYLSPHPHKAYLNKSKVFCGPAGQLPGIQEPSRRLWTFDLGQGGQALRG